MTYWHPPHEHLTAQERDDLTKRILRDPELTDSEAIARFVELAESQRKAGEKDENDR